MKFLTDYSELEGNGQAEMGSTAAYGFVETAMMGRRKLREDDMVCVKCRNITLKIKIKHVRIDYNDELSKFMKEDRV